MTRRDFMASALAAVATTAAAGAETAHPPIGSFVTVEGLRIHYVEDGRGPAVVLLHGASGNLRDFTFSLVDRLAAHGLRVIAFDRPGLGYSDRAPQRGWDPMVQARVLRGAAALLGVEQPVVVGHSWGGAAAMAWAIQAPEATRGVLSIAGATYPWGNGVGALYHLGATPGVSRVVSGLARLWVDEDDPNGVLEGIFHPNSPPPGYAAYVGVGLALRSAAFRHNAEDLVRLDDLLAEQAPLYKGLTMPVEAIHGEADRTVWAGVHSAPLARDVANGRLTMLPGVGHMPHHIEEGVTVEAVARLAGL